MTDSLEKLFGTPARLKLLRLFLFNPRHSFTVPEVAQRARIKEREASREIKLLLQIKLIKRVRRSARAVGVRYTLSGDFKYVASLQGLLLNTSERSSEVYNRVRRTGTIKLVVLAGVFVGDWEDRLDIFLVGDRVSERKLREVIRRFESEIGKELRYALLTTEDFFYRLNMNDHLVRDVFDYPHRIVEDRLNVGLK
jgi:predicted transcriptional regulator